MGKLLGGYHMIDCTGIDLYDSATVPGIYDKAVKAFQSQKPVLLYNIKIDSNPSGPIPGSVYPESGYMKILIAGYSYISISDSDYVVTV